MEEKNDGIKAGFRTTENKGFWITFDNGVTVSVQFGCGNYCWNRDKDINPLKLKAVECPNAEVAVWDSKDYWITEFSPIGKDYGETAVVGYCNPNDVLRVLNWASKLTEEKLEKYRKILRNR